MKTDSYKQPAILVLFVLVLLTLIWNAGRAGLGSLMTTQAAMANELGAVDEAIRLSPGNADAHSVRGTILEATDPAAASTEHYQAALARPDDYVLWLNLARARELSGDSSGAIIADREAVALAPAYAMPHYQLGNILLRAGQLKEAFKELAVAAASNPSLLPGVIDLAWRISGGSVSDVEELIAPMSPSMYRGLGDYFRLKNEIDAAIAMYMEAGDEAREDRRAFVGELINEKRFQESARLWGLDRSTNLKAGVMLDPGFEQEFEPKSGFGWSHGEDDKGVKLSLDITNPREGKSSLKVDFHDTSNSGSPVISQLVLIEPHAQYKLEFAIRSEDLVSGGPPRVVVMDASTKKTIAQSEIFPKATDGWREYQINFATEPSTEAVQIALQCAACGGAACPIFGRVWLDNFSLVKLGGR